MVAADEILAHIPPYPLYSSLSPPDSAPIVNIP